MSICYFSHELVHPSILVGWKFKFFTLLRINKVQSAGTYNIHTNVAYLLYAYYGPHYGVYLSMVEF
jgi:hypothetical protein